MKNLYGETPTGTLRPGSKGEQVIWVQWLFNTPGILDAGLKMDGSYGPKTTEAVKKFQKKYGLEVDGIFGPKSLAKLLKIVE